MTSAPSIFKRDLLAGQVALVTGVGAAPGRAVARELLTCGAEVVLAGPHDEVSAAAAELGPGTSCVAGDLRAAADAERIVEGTLARHGRIDTLVNNAGARPNSLAPAETIGAAEWTDAWMLGFDGAVRLAHLAAERAMRAAGGGTIINVTMSPHRGLPGAAHLSSARAALEAATRELAAEWEGDGVRVVALAAGEFEGQLPESAWTGPASVLLRRLAEPRELGWLVALAASPAGRTLSGSVVTIDGARDNQFGTWPPGSYASGGAEVPTEERRPG